VANLVGSDPIAKRAKTKKSHGQRAIVATVAQAGASTMLDDNSVRRLKSDRNAVIPSLTLRRARDRPAGMPL
jgi:hypothetical protein